MNQTSKTIVVQGVNFWLQVLFLLLAARLLGPEKQGAYAIIRTSVFLLESLMWFGFSSGVVYFLAKDSKKYHDLIVNLFLYLIIPLLVLIYVLINKVNVHWLGFESIRQSGIVLSLFVFWLASLTVTQLFQKVFLGLHEFDKYNKVTIINTIGTFVSFFIICKIKRLDVEWLILAHIIGNGWSLFYGFWVHKDKIRFINIFKLVWLKLIFELFKVGLKGFVSTLCFLIFYRFDFFLVGYYLGSHVLGLYSISVFIIEAIQKIPDWLGMILSPKIASNRGNASQLLKKYLSYSFGSVFLIGTVLFLAFSVFKLGFLQMALGQDYSGSARITLLLLPRALLHSVMVIYAADLAGKAYSVYHPLAGFVAMTVLLTLDSILIPARGILGAVAGITIAYVFATIIMFVGSHMTKKSTQGDVCLDQEKVLGY